MQRIDIAIIGGGIIGTSIAWSLAKAGVRSVALFERATIAAGASGRTGALLRQHYSNEAEALLAHRGYQMYRNWPEMVGGSCGHVPAPIVVTVDMQGENEKNREKMRRNIAMQNNLGIDTRIICSDELALLQPFSDWSDIDIAAFEPESGYVDAIEATRSMARAALDLGVQINEDSGVTAIISNSGRIAGIRTHCEQLTCDVVVCAAGPWSTQLLAPLGINLPIENLRVQIAILQRPIALSDDHYVYVDTAAGMFARPWGPGRSLVGVGGGDQHDVVDPDDFECRNDKTYPAAAVEAISRRIPSMKRAVYLHGHSGLYDMTPDAHPVIGGTSIAGLHIAAGFSGAGFKIAPAVGEAMARTILGSSPVQTGLAPFALERFEHDTWRQPWSPNEYTFSSDFGHGL